ncbi:hypothetical protein AtNW77_Chr1g0046211 [Arabidopsis thaliana]
MWQALIGRPFVFVERRKKKFLLFLSKIFSFGAILPINFLLFQFLLNLFPFLENT